MKPENEGSFFKRTSIRYMIFVYFTVTALAASIFIGLSLYSRMSKQMSDTMQEENQILIDQLNRSVDVWLRGIMKLSDTTYYGIVKNTDLRNESVNKEMTLLYDNNRIMSRISPCFPETESFWRPFPPRDSRRGQIRQRNRGLRRH